MGREEIDDVDVVGLEASGHFDVEFSQPFEGEGASAQDRHVDVADAFAPFVERRAEEIRADDVLSGGQGAPERLRPLQYGVSQEHR